MTIHKSGPAFPVVIQADARFNDGSGDPVFIDSFGMSLRDYFAAFSMAATIGKLTLADTEGVEGVEPVTEQFIRNRYKKIAISAYEMADAMLNERTKE